MSQAWTALDEATQALDAAAIKAAIRQARPYEELKGNVKGAESLLATLGRADRAADRQPEPFHWDDPKQPKGQVLHAQPVHQPDSWESPAQPQQPQDSKQEASSISLPEATHEAELPKSTQQAKSDENESAQMAEAPGQDDSARQGDKAWPTAPDQGVEEESAHSINDTTQDAVTERELQEPEHTQATAENASEPEAAQLPPVEAQAPNDSDAGDAGDADTEHTSQAAMAPAQKADATAATATRKHPQLQGMLWLLLFLFLPVK